MHALVAMLRVRATTMRHAALAILRGSKLRIVVVGCLMLFFWLLMFGLFLDAFTFVRDNFEAVSGLVMDYLFAFFFVSLLAMMGISNTIISYASLFHSEETEFLLSMPVQMRHAFTYRGSESAVFGAWGLTILVLPLILAYGLVFPVPWYFYPVSLMLAVLFVVLATEIGAVLALAGAGLLQRHKKVVLLIVVAVISVALFLWLRPLWQQEPEDFFTEATLKRIMDRIAFCQHWALPSRWVSHGILSAARGDRPTAVFHSLMLLSNCLFLGLAGGWLAHRTYGSVWQTVQGTSNTRRYADSRWRDAVGRYALFFLPERMRRLVLKDLTTFLRTPAQWSQFVLFFGLLGLYILNLPRFGVEALEAYWQSLVALLNLGATCLTLATLTSRFVFPQLSLEGRRIWITGLLPMRRSAILWGKFLFAASGTFVVSAFLIGLSGLMIGLPGWILAAHTTVVFCVCCGLNGLAVGLGALYPRLGTDSPAKIVSSFGGTLNLVCSVVLIVFCIAPVVAPLHMFTVGRWTLAETTPRLALGLAVVMIVSAAACLIPMFAGSRAFEKMEF